MWVWNIAGEGKKLVLPIGLYLHSKPPGLLLRQLYMFCTDCQGLSIIILTNCRQRL